ncbi:MoaD/ThiS family protein [Lysobacter claricitrinus]|uniref:MoaD/ThiS family protein n=1 Tax=Lysobacter claricitrinus TaxID=3367728 RepID=UPI0037DB2869
MRTIQIDLFGAMRDVGSQSHLSIASEARTVAELRAEIVATAADWPVQARALLPRSAFASSTTVLRDSDALPDDGRLALLPPVSGG